MIHVRRVLALALLTLVAGNTLASGEGAFGAAPTDVDYGVVLRDEPVERRVTLQNSRAEPAFVRFFAEGEAGAWIIESLSNETMPARSTRDLALVLRAPADAPNGAYGGAILATLSNPEEPPEGRASVAIEVAIRIHVAATVGGEERVAMAAGGLVVPETEEGIPILFHVGLQNLGNVRVAPVFDVAILDSAGGAVAAAAVAGPEVRPGQSTEASARGPAAPAAGSYTLALTVRVRGEVVHEERAALEVHEPGALRKKGRMGAVEILEIGGSAVQHRIPSGRGFAARALFENTGEVDVEAQWKGYVASEGRVLRELVSETQLVAPGDNATFRVLVTDPLPAGTYSVVGRVLFSGRATAENEAIVLVLPATELTSTRGGIPAPAAALVAVVALAAAALRLRR